MRIVVSYPDMSLSANRSKGKHWGDTNKARKTAFHEAYYATLEATKGRKLEMHNVLVAITFAQADKTHRDLDNLLSASKSTLDGIAKALGIDDRIFDPILIGRAAVTGKSYMLVEIKQD